MNKTDKLFHRDFLLVVIGQIISLFGNAILRFAIPLYLLNTTGSSSLYGMVLGISTIPMILLYPIGGMIADRVNKRNIMVILDFSTAALTFLFLLSLGRFNLIASIAVTMMLLYGIQGAYQPAVQASIPALSKEAHLLQANAVINQISALAGLLGPILGGVLFGLWGLVPVLIVGGICFLASAIMEIFIHIPFRKQKSEKNILATVRQDFKVSIHFMRREQPVIWKGMWIISMFNLFLSSAIMVGFPVLVTKTLGLGSQWLGYTQGALAAGGLAGGILTGVLAGKLKVQQSSKLLLGSTLFLLPIGLSLLLNPPVMVTYIIITVCSFLLMMAATMFTIQMMAFVQGVTPPHLIGKIISWIMALCMCAQPIGQGLYGILFDALADQTFIIIFGAAISSAVISLFSKKVFGAMTGTPAPEIQEGVPAEPAQS